MRRVSVSTWACSVVMVLSLHVLGVLSWRLTVNLGRAGLGMVEAARCYYAGLFGTVFLPSIVGGDVIRVGMAYGNSRSRTGLVVGSVLARLIDFTGLVILAGVGAALLPNDLKMLGHNFLLPVVGVVVLGPLTLAALGFLIPARRLPRKLRRLLVNLRRAFRPMMRQPWYILVALALAVTLQGSLVLVNAWLGERCGLDCPLAVWLFVWPMAKLVAVLPITQGGVGVREAALAALFLPFGVPTTQALAVGLVYQSVIITSALLAGPLAVALGYFPSLRREVASL